MLWQDVGFKPATTIDKGIGRFVQWYREYYAGYRPLLIIRFRFTCSLYSPDSVFGKTVFRFQRPLQIGL